MKHISICIPTYEMHGSGAEFLEFSFGVLEKQTFKDFDVVVSDHSRDDKIQNLCEAWNSRLDIHYFRNAEKRGSSSANMNSCIRNATGKIIKILLQDDFLYSEDSLQKITDSFDLAKDGWLVTACIHTTDGHAFFRPFQPRYNDMIHIGKNTISSPSVLTIRNQDPLFFDENLLWYTDSDYYKRCHDRFGDPKILDSINVVNRIGAHQVTNTLINDRLKEKEYAYMLEKYQVKNASSLLSHMKATHRIARVKKTVKKLIGMKNS